MIALTASTVQAKPRAAGGGYRMLIAENSPVIQDVLKLVLGRRGHQVDSFTDGQEALEALRKNRYDIALLDYHLPGMSGAEIAATIIADAGGDADERPMLVAITADAESLITSPGVENFDQIIPKPLDIFKLGNLVEQPLIKRARTPEVSKPVAEPKPVKPFRLAKPDARTAPVHLSFFENSGYQFLTWPGDLSSEQLSQRALDAISGDPQFDAILVTEPASIDAIGTIWQRKSLFALPVIDLAGTLGMAADLDVSKLNVGDTSQIGRLFEELRKRRANLSRDILFSEDLGEKLIGRAYVMNKPIVPSYAPSSRECILYNMTLRASLVIREADQLCEQDLLERKLFDRFNVCPRCDSVRLHVREECSKCRSPDITEEPYLHHFKCAYQGPESRFRRGENLVCPKCKQELRHFSVDYDRPGTMLVCNACGHAASEPSVGFVCIDCGGHADSQTCSTRDIYSYELTSQGTGFAEYGRSFLGQARQVLRFSEFPIELVIALNAAAKDYNERSTPFTLINIFYPNEREITIAQGARQFALSRDLFLENLRGKLGKSAAVIKGLSYDFALLKGRGPDEVRGDFETFREAGQRSLRFDLGAKLQAFGPQDFL
jgi:CheY-like chemotaxis protein